MFFAAPFRYATLSAVIAALPLTALAVDEVVTLPEVVVKAAKGNAAPMPLNEMKLDEASLQGLVHATSDTASLLRDVPGVSLYGAGGVSSLPSIHGLADDRLRIKVDGMDLIAACPNHMNPALSYVDPSHVASIKVYTGVTPVSVGGDSLGGTIQVESAPPTFAGAGQGALLKGEAGAFYRSNGDAMGANLGVTIANENLSLNYSGSTAQSDNYRAGGNFKTTTATGRPGHTLPLDEVGSTAYESTNQTLDLGLRSGNHLLDLKISHQDIPYEGFPNQRMDMTSNISNKVDLGYTGQYDWGVLKARAYHEKTEHEMQFGDDKQYWYGMMAPYAPGMPMNTEGKTTGASVKADMLLSQRDTLRVGAEFQSYRLDDWWPPSGTGMMMAPNTFWNIRDGQRDRYAVFGEWEARFDPQWSSLLGVRHETVSMDTGDVVGYSGMYQTDANAFNLKDRSKTDQNLDLTALGRYTADANATYEFGYAQKTRSPNLYERYTWSTMAMAAIMNNFVGDGNGYVGDPNLKPEVAHTLSISADWHDAARKNWSVQATPYYTHVQDYIDAKCNGSCTANQFNVLKYVNQSARLYGLDISGHVLLGILSGFGSFNATGMLNYVNGENRDTGDNLYNIMPLNAKLALTQKLGAWTNTFEGQFVGAKDDVSQVRNEIKTDGYSLFNFRSSYEWKQVRLDVGVENLFDKNYALPLGGAYLGQGSTMAINPGMMAPLAPAWGTAVPGQGRSIYAGVSVKF